MKKILLLLIGFSVHGQQLHHQMLSSQGTSNLLKSGTLIHQTLGQQSTIGNYKLSNSVIGQGFQQSVVSASSFSVLPNEIVTTTFPNPFIDHINFLFSRPVSGLISISIFDLLGKVIFKGEKEATQNILSIDNLHFAQNEYLVKLSAKNYNYSTHIIQTK